MTSVTEVRSASARLFAGMWCPLVSVITTLLSCCKFFAIIFRRRMWYRALFLHYACIQSSGIILIPWATFVPNFISLVTSIAELAHREISCTRSLTQLICSRNCAWLEKNIQKQILTESEACERPPAADVLPSLIFCRHFPVADAAAEEWCDVFCAFFPPPLAPRHSNFGDLTKQGPLPQPPLRLSKTSDRRLVTAAAD